MEPHSLSDTSLDQPISKNTVTIEFKSSVVEHKRAEEGKGGREG